MKVTKTKKVKKNAQTAPDSPKDTARATSGSTKKLVKDSSKKKAPRKESNAPYRDKLYNYSDVLTVLLILLVAGLFIFWRVHALLSYAPASLNDMEDLSVEQVDTTLQDKDALDQAIDADQAEINKTGNYTAFTISSASTLEVIAQNLLDEGLITDTAEFTERVRNSNKEGELKVGTYEIPEGATITEIIDMFTSVEE